jgi:hypothetical protein
MARSNVLTWLPLDRWAEIIGLFPLHWNGLDSNTIKPNNVCGEVFFQYSWQHSDRIGRDDIAMAIQAAEREISAEVGYNLMPDWVEEERLQYPQPFVPGSYNLYGTNPRGMLNSVELPRGHIISGGVKNSTLIQANAIIVRSDVDGDGYQETATVTVPTTVTDEDEIRIYYNGHNGDDGWEIRPITVVLSGGNAIITFKVWQVPVESSIDALNPSPLDADLVASYETLVDVYRVFNNPNTQLQFMWENSGGLDCCGSCTACQFGTQAGCFHNRDARLGLVVPAPASWDESAEEFTTAEWTACRAPDQIRFWYYSGFRNTRLARPLVTMDPYWEYAVAYYAASKIDRPVCGCSNVNQFIDKWRRDLLINKNDDANFNVTAEMLSNKLGTTMGAVYAWKRIHQGSMRIAK